MTRPNQKLPVQEHQKTMSIGREPKHGKSVKQLVFSHAWGLWGVFQCRFGRKWCVRRNWGYFKLEPIKPLAISVEGVTIVSDFMLFCRMPQLVFVGQAGTSKISRVRVVGLMKNMDETMSTFDTSPNARPQASAYCQPSVWRTAQMSVTGTRSARSCLPRIGFCCERVPVFINLLHSFV